MKYIVDTNVILGNPEILEHYDVDIPQIVLEEIETLELKKSNSQLQFEIRNAKRALHKAVESGKTNIFDLKNERNHIEGYASDYADNIILKIAQDKGYGIITNDLLMILKAKPLGIEIISPMFDKRDNNGYEGLIDLNISDNEEDALLLALIEENIGKKLTEDSIKKYNLLENQYLIFWENQYAPSKRGTTSTKVIDRKNVGVFKFNGNSIFRVNGNKIHSDFDVIVPRNVRQRCAIDMLQDEKTKIKALFGTFGAGKDYLMLGQALAMVNDDACPIDKIVWVRNNIEVKDSNPIGFLPNSLEDKLMPFLMPLVDHLGGEKEILETMMAEGKIEVQHLGFIRGRDIKNAIIYVTEVQSNTLEHIQLLIGRVGEGSQIWFNGDDQQTDSNKFEFNNGVRALKKLSGQSLYGQVTLDKTERSEVARLSAILGED